MGGRISAEPVELTRGFARRRPKTAIRDAFAGQSMRTLKPKLIVPRARRRRPGGSGGSRPASTICGRECHLAANTIAAYRRDLARFSEWLGGRDCRPS